jgi:regulator of protease activity HflC (stomatin/prohibitin superfamily)
MSNNKEITQFEEVEINTHNGFAALFLNILLTIAIHVAFIWGLVQVDKFPETSAAFGTGIAILLIGYFVLLTLNIIFYCGFVIIKPNEAAVFTCFGKYVGVLKEDGFYWKNPFYIAYNPLAMTIISGTNEGAAAGAAMAETKASTVVRNGNAYNAYSYSRKISLKVNSLKNDKQKVNDELGNPIEVGINVFWRITDLTKAVFAVENYKEYLSMQADAALRQVVRSYPYDMGSDSDEMTLRGSSTEVANKIKALLQEKAAIAGIEITEARITNLAYAPEIAAAMLQRQQATAIIDARQKIVEGAVSMVEMALTNLSERKVVELDDERRAQMVSNLLVVLCGTKEAQPIVNSGSIY